MNWNTASQVNMSDGSTLRQTTQNHGQHPQFKDIVQSSSTKISEEEFTKFEDFLNDPDTNERIEIAAERHHFSGSHFAYDTAVQEVAYRHSSFPRSHVPELLRLHKMQYALYQRSLHQARVNKILEKDRENKVLEESSHSESVDIELPDITHVIEQFPPFGVSTALLDLLSDIESMHVKELSEEDMAQYSTLDVLGRLNVWENSLFKNDPLYERLRVLRTR